MRKSISRENLAKLDKSGMLDLLLDFPLQLGAAREIAKKARILFEKKDFTKEIVNDILRQGKETLQWIKKQLPEN